SCKYGRPSPFGSEEKFGLGRVGLGIEAGQPGLARKAILKAQLGPAARRAKVPGWAKSEPNLARSDNLKIKTKK
ncbi:hypothetical protein PanWU01x14_182090, partial [Parasponia andersonii]